MNRKIKNDPEVLELYTESGAKAGTLVRYADGHEDYQHAVHVRRDVKDRLFKFIFGNPEHKDWALNLYNALENKHYTDVNDLVITTLEDAVFMKMKNDVSVLVDSRYLDFWEHQSTLSPNIPIRFFLYSASTLQRLINTREHELYEEAPFHIPFMKFYVFYNGKKYADLRSELKLSDLYYNCGEEPMLELKAIQLNINDYEKWKDICPQLYEYQWFVTKSREYSKKTDLSTAVNLAINEMPEEFTIRSFLLAHRSEVIAMSIFEYDEEKHMEYVRSLGVKKGEIEGFQKGRLEGFQEGKTEGFQEGEIEGFRKGILNSVSLLIEAGIPEKTAIEKTAEKYGYSVLEIQRMMQNSTEQQ